MNENIQTIIETVCVGNSVKITAIDVNTGLEATVICPENTTKTQREQLAIKKLHYLLSKKSAIVANKTDSNGNLY